MSDFTIAPHLPRAAPIDAYGRGGFRFAGMSHRGSILCRPDGIWAWPVTSCDDISMETLAPILSEGARADYFVLATGKDLWRPPQPLQLALREAGLRVEVMQTGPAVRTYNVLLAENRLVAAALIAVD